MDMKSSYLLFFTIVFGLTAQACFGNEWYYENATYSNEECCYEDSLFDENRFYTQFFAGANFIPSSTSGGLTTKYNAGYIVAGSLGYRFCYGLRLEAEYAYRRNSLESLSFFGRTYSIHGNFQTSSYMANVFWDLPLCQWGCHLWGIEPFIGAGIGYDSQHVHGSNSFLVLADSKRGFAWQVMAGLSYLVFCNTRLSIEYKFHQGPVTNIYNHAVGVGLTYDFDFCSR